MATRPTEQEILRFPLVGSLTSRDPLGLFEQTLGNKGQRFFNCYPKVVANPLTNKTTIFLTKRPGSGAVAFTTAGTYSSTGCVEWTSHSTAYAPPVVFSFTHFSNSVMEYWSSSGSQIGADIPTSGAGLNCYSLVETKNAAGTGCLVTILDGATGREGWVFTEGGAWVQITDADFPITTQVGDPVFLDGYMFVLTTGGALHNSDINSLTAWSALSFINTSAYPDAGVGLAKHHNTIVVFGTNSIEFYENIGNDIGSPLRRIPERTLKIGAYPTSVLPLNSGSRGIVSGGDIIYFIGKSDTGKVSIYKLQDFKVEQISTPFIDQYIGVSPNGLTGVTTGLGGVISIDGMQHLLTGIRLTPTSCLVYCIDTGFWWSLSIGDENCPDAGVGGYFAYGSGISVFADPRSTDLASSGATPFTMSVTTSPIDVNSQNIKFWDSIELVGYRNSDSAGGTTNISWSDDDYQTFSTPRSVTTSAARMRLPQCGSSRRRILRITDAESDEWIMEGIELVYRMGHH